MTKDSILEYAKKAGDFAAIGLGLGILLSIPTFFIVLDTSAAYGNRLTEIWRSVVFSAKMILLYVVLGALLGLLAKLLENAKYRRRAAVEQVLNQKLDQQNRLLNQQNSLKELHRVCDEAIGAFEELPRYLDEAEEWIDQAERNYKEGVFAPFWDAIEHATRHLGRFSDAVMRIDRNLKKYNDLSRVCNSKPPPFPIAFDSSKSIDAGRATADRMRAMVRQAQKSYHFASIYEQRKTNQILVAGFNNLSQAIDGMGHRISESIESLSAQVSGMSTSLKSTMDFLGEQSMEVNRSTGAISGSIQEMRSALQIEVRARAERHDQALRMLDNIQRRRVPKRFL